MASHWTVKFTMKLLEGLMAHCLGISWLVNNCIVNNLFCIFFYYYYYFPLISVPLNCFYTNPWFLPFFPILSPIPLRAWANMPVGFSCLPHKTTAAHLVNSVSQGRTWYLGSGIYANCLQAAGAIKMVDYHIERKTLVTLLQARPTTHPQHCQNIAGSISHIILVQLKRNLYRFFMSTIPPLEPASSKHTKHSDFPCKDQLFCICIVILLLENRRV